ncbi:MAG TPA: helix-turn-helix transcriptional regulator [Nitrospiria bacterium]
MKKESNKNPHKQLQNLLRQIRQEAGLRQADLAKRLGKPQSYVSKYELGERRLDLVELNQICKTLKTSLDEFVRKFQKFL